MTILEHPDAQALLADATLSADDVRACADSLTAFAKSLYSPTNGDCKFPPEEEKRLVLGEKHVDSIREVPWKEILPQRDAILDRWTREFGS